jgi:hypothetical protein
MSMKSFEVKVRPAQGGWLVFPGCAEPQVFFSGAHAEARAHRIGRSIARTGSDAMVVVHDRADQVVGTTRYFGDGGPL